MQVVMPPIQAFVDLVHENQKEGMVVCEVGCFSGDTSIGWLPIVKQNNGRAYLIDWFYGTVNPLSDDPHSYRADNHDKLLNVLKENIKEIDCEDIVTILDGPSHEMLMQIPDYSLDIGFVDANHAYTYAKQDISITLRKIKIGGIICGHDFEGYQYANKFPMELLELDTVPNVGCHGGVIQAVYDLFGETIEMRKSNIGQSPHIPIWIKRC